PHRDPGGDHGEDATQGVAVRAGPVDGANHPGLRGLVRGAHGRGLDLRPVDLVRHLGRDLANARDVAEDLDAECLEQLLGHAPGGHTAGGLAGGGSLQHVANVVEAEFEGAGQVGVTGADAGDLGRREPGRSGRHRLLPVGKIAVCYHHRHRRPQAPSQAHPPPDLDLVSFDLLTPTPPIAALSALEVDVDIGRTKSQARRQTVHDHHQPRAVRLAGGEKADQSDAPVGAPEPCSRSKRTLRKCCGSGTYVSTSAPSLPADSISTVPKSKTRPNRFCDVLTSWTRANPTERLNLPMTPRRKSTRSS